MRRLSLLLATMSLPAAAQTPIAPAIAASNAEIRTIVADMAMRMRDGRGFLYRPLLKDGETVAALEY